MTYCLLRCRLLHRFTYHPHQSSVIATNLFSPVGSCSVRDFRRTFSLTEWTNWFAASKPVIITQDYLSWLHDVTSLPWWGTVLLTTVTLRTFVTFPLIIYQNHVMARLENLQPEIKEIAMALKKETDMAVRMYNLSEKEAKNMYRRSLKEQVKKLIIRENCHPAKSGLVIWFQIPMWVCVSFALRNMTKSASYSNPAAMATYLEFSTGGLLWFPDLTLPDPSFILPFLVGATNLVIVEVHSLRKLELTKFQKIMTYLTRGISLILIPIAMAAPSCISFYWLCSSAVGLGHNFLLMSPKFRRLCRIPRRPSESLVPYQDLRRNFSARWKYPFSC